MRLIVGTTNAFLTFLTLLMALVLLTLVTRNSAPI